LRAGRCVSLPLPRRRGGNVLRGTRGAVRTVAAARPRPADGDARTRIPVRLARRGLPFMVLRAWAARLQLVRSQSVGMAQCRCGRHGHAAEAAWREYPAALAASGGENP